MYLNYRPVLKRANDTYIVPFNRTQSQIAGKSKVFSDLASSKLATPTVRVIHYAFVIARTKERKSRYVRLRSCSCRVQKVAALYRITSSDRTLGENCTTSFFPPFERRITMPPPQLRLPPRGFAQSNPPAAALSTDAGPEFRVGMVSSYCPKYTAYINGDMGSRTMPKCSRLHMDVHTVTRTCVCAYK